VVRDRAVVPLRTSLVVLVVTLGVTAMLAASGPVWYQRLFHPLAYEGQIAASAARHGVDPYLVAAVISAESGFDADGVSPKGAVGLMQLMPETAAEEAATVGLAPVTGDALSDPEFNIELGTTHLARLLERYGDVNAAVVAYNAGMGTTDTWLANGPIESTVAFDETRAYLERVLSERERYRELYPDAF
jgi:soluble lytic murein transglycosylase